MKRSFFMVGLTVTMFAFFLGGTHSVEATNAVAEATKEEVMAQGYTEEQYQQMLAMPDFSLEELPDAAVSTFAARSAAPVSASQKTQVVNETKKHLGKPYAWGGKGPNSFDCSGLTRYAYLQVTGKNIGDYTVPQEKAGDQISVAQAEPGDLFFWGTKGNTYHVAVYAGKNSKGQTEYIHAPDVNQVVRVNTTEYFKPDFAVRVLKNDATTATSLSYRTHIQTFGWENYIPAGEISGTVGLAKRLEGIQIRLGTGISGNVEYRTHVQTYGWQDWKSNDAVSGTQGQAKRLEAIQIQLSGAVANQYDVHYRVHAQTYGWLGWAKNGQQAGTEGLAKRLEAIEIKLVPKNTAMDTSATAFVKK